MARSVPSLFRGRKVSPDAAMRASFSPLGNVPWPGVAKLGLYPIEPAFTFERGASGEILGVARRPQDRRGPPRGTFQACWPCRGVR